MVGGCLMEKYLLLSIIVICSIIFVVSLFIHKIEMFVNFILRLAFGTSCIYFLNMVLSSKGIQSGVGLNGVSLLTVGVLGMPGFLLLYSTAIYFYVIGK